MHGVGPELVTGGVGVELVGHDRERNLSVLPKEDAVDVEETDILAVVESRELGVHAVDDLHLPRGLGGHVGSDLTVLVGTRPAGEHGEHEHLHAGNLGADHADDLAIGGGDLGGVVRAGVVGTEHEHGDLRGQAVKFPVLNAPDDVLSLVAADSEIRRLPLAVVVLPDVRRLGPALRDRVADENDAHGARLAPREKRFVHLAEAPAGVGFLDRGGRVRLRAGGSGSGGASRAGCDQTGQHAGEQEGAGIFHGEGGRMDARKRPWMHSSRHSPGGEQVVDRVKRQRRPDERKAGQPLAREGLVVDPDADDKLHRGS